MLGSMWVLVESALGFICVIVGFYVDVRLGFSWFCLVSISVLCGVCLCSVCVLFGSMWVFISVLFGVYLVFSSV